MLLRRTELEMSLLVLIAVFASYPLESNAFELGLNYFCNPNPCQNNGLCSRSSLSITGFACSCPSGWDGHTCDQQTPVPSIDDPCLNGGKFIVGSQPNAYTCQCSDGWAGSRCEKPVNCIWESSADTKFHDEGRVPLKVTKEECETTCLQTPGCHGFDYVSSCQSCYLNTKSLVEHYTLHCGGGGHTPTVPRPTEAPTWPPTVFPVTFTSPAIIEPETTSMPMSTTTSPTILKDCDVKLDLVFIVDVSSSLCATKPKGCDSWKANIDFIYALTQGLVIGPDATRVAMIKFGNKAVVKWKLNDPETADEASVLKAISKLVHDGGNTRTDLALHKLVDEVYVLDAGDRPDIPNLAIIITDGNPSNKAAMPAAYKRVQRSERPIMTIGVGIENEAIQKTLESIAEAGEAKSTFFIIKTYEAAKNILSALHIITCEADKYF